MKRRTSRRTKCAFDWKASGHRLRVTRIALGISESEAAAAHGVTLATYRKYEAGAPQRASFGFVSYAEKYDVSLNWLVGGDGFLAGPHLTKNHGGKVAILPVMTADARRRHDSAGRLLNPLSCG